MVSTEQISQVSLMIREARQIAVLTGAGVSAESGVPTFRDAMDGLWSRYDPLELATQQAFLQNPKLVWDWYEYRREMVKKAQPNPGHFALAELQRRYPSLRIITQNVDDLHERAGSTDVIHLHGNIAATKCFYNCQGEPTIVDISTLEWDKENGPPPCPYCGRPLRPDVVWFGENLPAEHLNQALGLSSRVDLMLVIGTSGVVMPAAKLPFITRRSEGQVVEINPVKSEITQIANVWLEGASGEVPPQVVAGLD